MYHSITIGDINTWDDWHMVPESRPVINPPEVKTQYIDIPGANGSLDYTEALTGAPVFKDRTGSWTFIVMNGYQEWNTLFYKIMNYLHGRRHRVILEDDPDYMYEGRLSFNEWRSEPNYSKVVIDYVLSPFKEFVGGSASDWRWDDLTFNTDIYTIYYGTFSVDGEKIRTLYNPLDREVELSLLITSPMRIWMYGEVFEFPTGNIEHTNIILEPGNNVMTFIGTGQVTVNYDRGSEI